MNRPKVESEVEDAKQFASKFQIDSRETLDRLILYVALLHRWQPAVNLVAPATLPQAWNRHMADSAQLATLVPEGAESLVDLGSGGGFPGLVLAIMLGGGSAAANPRQKLRRVILVESDQRKAAFLREVARQTGTSVEVVSARIEKPETRTRIGTADVVSARALAALDKLLDWAQPLFGPQTVGLFLKGRDAAAEIDAARQNWQFDATQTPSITDDRAAIVSIRNLVSRQR